MEIFTKENSKIIEGLGKGDYEEALKNK